jgi:hypothetical protein
MSFAKCRPSVFGSILTPINLNTNGSNSKRKWFESELRENFLINSQNTNKSETFETINESINKKCCAKDHISELSVRQRKEVLNYYQSMETHDQQNEYLKSVVIPVPVLERTVTDSQRNQTLEYYLRIKDENNPNITISKKVCKKAFLALHNIKRSRLEKKIRTNRDQTQDMRGRIGHHRYSFEVECDIREFIENYPSRESHYCDSVRTGRKYLGPDKNITSIHKEFLDKYQEYDNYVSYSFFCHIFKDCNVGFGYPRADICCLCEEMSSKMQDLKKSQNLVENKSIEMKLKEHQNEAKFFYDLQNKLKASELNNSKIEIICNDYEKNFYLPVTNVSIEYYSRQLSVHNFCVHNMKTGKAFMYMYSENFALKGPNETISFIHHYMKQNIKSEVEEVIIFSDNNFAQNKSRYIWLFYDSLVVNKVFKKITIIYPIPGHSYLDCDRDFGLIEKKRHKTDKVCVPSEYVKLVESANNKIPFEVIYANYSLSNDLSIDGHKIVKVLDYKNLMSDYLLSNLEHLSNVRIIEFSKESIKVSLDLRKKPEIELKLVKANQSIIGLDKLYSNLKPAYEHFLPIKKEKYEDIKKLLNYCCLPEGTTFYSDDYLKINENHCSKSIKNNSKLCDCKGKCVIRCECKKNDRKCSELCLCNSEKCKNNNN